MDNERSELLQVTYSSYWPVFIKYIESAQKAAIKANMALGITEEQRGYWIGMSNLCQDIIDLQDNLLKEKKVKKTKNNDYKALEE